MIRHALSTVESFWKSLHDDAEAVGLKLKPSIESVHDLNSTHIEHIFPQSPRIDEWPETLAGLEHRLGNLTLLSADDNFGVSNLNFESKSADYRGASLAITRSVAESSDWTEQEIEGRETLIASMLCRIYSVPAIQKSGGSSSNPRSWLIAQRSTDNPYGDDLGSTYAFTRSLPNGRRVASGDYFAVLLLSGSGSSRSRRIVGIGRIGRLDEDENGKVVAFFSHFAWLGTPVELDDLPADPRQNRQHSINQVSADWCRNLLADGQELEDLPRVPQQSS